MLPKRIAVPIVLLVSALVAATTLTAAAGAPGRNDSDRLEMYRATVDSATLQTLQRGGYDVASVKETAKGVQVSLVLTGAARSLWVRPCLSRTTFSCTPWPRRRSRSAQIGRAHV